MAVQRFKSFRMLVQIFVLLNLFDYLSSFSTGAEFQQVILKSLGLKKPPVVTLNKTTTCIDYLRSLENSRNEYEIDCFDQIVKNGKNFSFSFQRPPELEKKFFIRLFRNQSAKIERFVVRISVGVNWHQEKISENGWLEIEVTELLAKGNGEENNLGIECLSLNMSKTLSFQQAGISTTDPYQPILISKTRQILSRAKRRSNEKLIDNEDEEDLGNSLPQYDDQFRICEAVPVYYKFGDYGWDNWIISPKGFSSTFCRGKCSFPLKSDLRPTNHAIVQSLMQLMYPEKYPEPCCSPDQTESLQIVYFDQNNRPRFRRLQNLVIKSCRCI